MNCESDQPPESLGLPPLLPLKEYKPVVPLMRRTLLSKLFPASCTLMISLLSLFSLRASITHPSDRWHCTLDSVREFNQATPLRRSVSLAFRIYSTASRASAVAIKR